VPQQSICFIADLGSQNSVDFEQLTTATSNGAKCEGVILRATRSNCKVDTAFASRFAAAAKAGFLVGAYAFNTGETAAVQANRFLQVTGKSGAIFRALDFEKNPSGGQMSLAAAIEFLDRVGQATGYQPWLYSGDRIKSLIVSATDAQRDSLAQHGLWGCEYGPQWKNVDAKGKTLPWPTATIWQYTGDGIPGPRSLPTTMSGLQPGADLSIFNGTRQDLAKIWTGATVAPAATVAAVQSLAGRQPLPGHKASVSVGAARRPSRASRSKTASKAKRKR
jgi:GH25 family lysozyme M1 (1,4-beta-N-acetylmuramidase)